MSPVDVLIAHLEWADGPWLGFVFAEDEEAVRQLQTHVEGAQQWIQPRTPQDLRQSLPRLHAATPARLMWLMAWFDEDLPREGPVGPWTEALDWFLMRANERRQTLLNSIEGGLLIVLPQSAKSRVREAAPDLWSVRAIVLELPATSPRQRPNATGQEGRIAGVVRRALFHSRMRDAPWFALVHSDDPAALAQLQTQLTPDVAWRELPTAVAEIEALCLGQLAHSYVYVGSPTAVAELPPGVHEAAAFHADLDRPDAPVPDPSPWLEEVPTEQAPVEALDGLVATASAVWEQGWAAETYEAADRLVTAAAALPPSPDVDRRHASGLELRARAARLQGDLATAMSDVDGAVVLRRRLGRLHGQDAPHRRSELARAVSLRGQLHLDLGDRSAAATDLQAALDHRLALCAWSDDAEALAELALSWSLLGDLALADDPPSTVGLQLAESHTREAFRLRRRLAEETGAFRHRRQHGIAWGRLGRVLERQLRMREAALAHKEAVTIATALANREPANMTLRMEESVARTQLAAATWARGDAQDARDEVQRAVALRRALLDEDPTNAKWAERLAVVLGQLAEMALHDGDLPIALAAATEAVEHSGSLSPTSPSQLRGQALATLRLGDVLHASGDTDQATACWQSVDAMLPKLMQKSPTRGAAVQQALRLRFGAPS